MVIRVIVIVRVRDRVTFSVTRGKLVSIACEVNVHLMGVYIYVSLGSFVTKMNYHVKSIL